MLILNKRKWGLGAVLLALTLVFAACGDNNQPAGAGAEVNATPTLVTENSGNAVIVNATATPAATIVQSNAVTTTQSNEAQGVAAGAAVSESGILSGAVNANVDIITGTQLITNTEVTTNVVVQTDTAVIEQQLITTVITATNLVTDVTSASAQSTQTTSEVMTSTSQLTPVATEIAASADVNVTPLTPTPTPTIVVQLTRVVTATEVVTEVVPTMVTATPPPLTPTPTIVVQLTRVITGTEVVTNTRTITAVATPRAGATVSATVGTGTGNVNAALLIFVGIQGANNKLIRASNLVGYNFQNVDGQVSGQIKDLLIDTGTGQVLYATLEYGGFLDIGDTELPVPLSAFVWGSRDQLVLNFDEQSLQNFPDLGTNWPDLTNANWNDQVANFWNSIGIDPGFDATQLSGSVAWASDLMGYGISDVGYGAGTIEDMLVDLGEGRVKYVLLSFPNANLANGEWIAVPFIAFDPAGFANQQFIFRQNFDANVLQQAPRFNQSQADTSGIFDNSLDVNWDSFWNNAGYPLNGNQ
ncbi:MAG: PRC-barrel domain-containing protein [Caldilineaceae bacterium]